MNSGFHLKIAVVKLVLVNLVPVIGVLFFDWQLLEIAVSYLLETVAIYLVWDMDHFLINKKTRFPFPMAVLQLVFTMAVFLAIMFGLLVVIYIIITPPAVSQVAFQQHMEYRLKNLEMIVPFAVLVVIEFITYYMRKAKDAAHLANSTWRVVRRILYSHLYILAGLGILSIFPQNLFVFIPFFIGLKMVLEYSTEDERIFKALRMKFLQTRIGKRLAAYFEEKPEPRGYLLKKRTYRRTRRME